MFSNVLNNVLYYANSTMLVIQTTTIICKSTTLDLLSLSLFKSIFSNS